MDGCVSLLRLLIIFISCHFVACESNREEIRMPGFRPSYEDYYVCTSIPVSGEKYITQYEALAEASTAHHILLFGCDEPYSDSATWDCGNTCRGDSSIMFAWAKNAPPTTLPKDVGYHVGGASKIKYIVMQVHYLRALSQSDPADRSGIAIYTTTSVPKYTQGILLMVAGIGSIPANTPLTTIDVSCRYNGATTIYPFAFRTHAHTLSTVISAYKRPKRYGQWELLGKGNPQWPQSFYPMNRTHQINDQDILAARCVYNSTNRDRVTTIGSTHNDEMCNFYMMYYVEGEAEFITCNGNQLPRQAKSLPPESEVRLPPNPKLDEIAAGHHHHQVDEPVKVNPTEPTFHVNVDGNSVPYMAEAENWYAAPEGMTIGQLGGVDTDSEGNVMFYHRGSHVWDGSSFDDKNVYQQQEAGAISEKTLVKLDSSGNLVESWGDNLFYLPHGITIDHEGNIWLTDVAMHQVFKFSASDKMTASLTLGEKFKPGSDEAHFCKPTDVAVMADGSFFVSDGYCNGRIIHFDSSGNTVKVWGNVGSGAPNRFTVVHSLALSEKLNQLCAADRENRRIQCFNIDNKFLYKHDCDVNPFALAFIPNTDKMVVAKANQKAETGKLSLLHVFPMTAENMGDFSPVSKSFSTLHDVAISKDGQAAYVAQLDPPFVYKFMISIRDSVDSSIDAKAISTAVGKKLVPKHKPLDSEDDAKDTVSQTVPIVVGVLLLVPIVCVLVGLLVYKIYKARQHRDIHGAFDMGNIFGSGGKRPRGDMAGFSPLATNEDHYTDSEEESVNERKTFVKP